MPEGSSADAPVTRPGPSERHAPRSPPGRSSSGGSAVAVLVSEFFEPVSGFLAVVIHAVPGDPRIVVYGSFFRGSRCGNRTDGRLRALTRHGERQGGLPATDEHGVFEVDRDACHVLTGSISPHECCGTGR